MAKRKTTVQILKDARALLVKNGWCQRTLRTDDGRLCALGAINQAITGDAKDWGDAATPSPYTALGVAISMSAPSYPWHCINTDPIADWNNARARTKRQVLAAFSRAIKAEEAKKTRATP